MQDEQGNSSFFFFLRALQRPWDGGLGYSFRTLFKNCYKTKNPYLITLKIWGADKQHIKANPNSMNLKMLSTIICVKKLKVFSDLQDELLRGIT